MERVGSEAEGDSESEKRKTPKGAKKKKKKEFLLTLLAVPAATPARQAAPQSSPSFHHGATSARESHPLEKNIQKLESVWLGFSSQDPLLPPRLRLPAPFLPPAFPLSPAPLPSRARHGWRGRRRRAPPGVGSGDATGPFIRKSRALAGETKKLTRVFYGPARGPLRFVFPLSFKKKKQMRKSAGRSCR